MLFHFILPYFSFCTDERCISGVGYPASRCSLLLTFYLEKVQGGVWCATMLLSSLIYSILLLAHAFRYTDELSPPAFHVLEGSS